MRRFGSKQMTRKYWRTKMLLIWSANPDGFDPETWARRTGWSVAEVNKRTRGAG